MRVALILPLLFAACGGSSEPKCEKFCDSVRGELIENFGIQPDQINCSDPQWDTDDCQQCVDLLLNDFDVQPTGGVAQCESQ